MSSFSFLRVLVDGASLAVVARRHGAPVRRQRRHGARVEHPETEQMIELQAHTVHRPMETALKHLSHHHLPIYVSQLFTGLLSL